MQEYTHAINELAQCQACSKLHWACEHLKGAVQVAKEQWMRKTCKGIEKGGPFRYWDAVKHISSVFCGYHSKRRNSKLLKPDGSLTKSDEETGDVFCNYFEKVFNNTNWWASPRGYQAKRGAPWTWQYTSPNWSPKCHERMAIRKAAGDNKILLEAYKYLTGDNFDYFILLLLISGIRTIQLSSMLLNCAFYPKKVTSTCQRITRVCASRMLPRKSSARLLLIDVNQSSCSMV